MDTLILEGTSKAKRPANAGAQRAYRTKHLPSKAPRADFHIANQPPASGMEFDRDRTPMDRWGREVGNPDSLRLPGLDWHGCRTPL